MPGGRCRAWLFLLSNGISSAGVFLFDVARALRHGLLIPVMLSGILAAVAMEWWECCLVCACGVVIGWKARGVLRAEATESKTEPPSSEWASEIGTFWDPRAKKTWRISISELSFACEGQNNIIKARVCGEQLAVHFSERKIITGKFDQSGLLNWGHAVDGDGTPLWRSRADPWQRVEGCFGRIGGKVSLTPTLDYLADLGETAGEDRGALRRLGEAVRREDEGGPDPTSTRPNFDFDPRR